MAQKMYATRTQDWAYMAKSCQMIREVLLLAFVKQHKTMHLSMDRPAKLRLLHDLPLDYEYRFHIGSAMPLFQTRCNLQKQVSSRQGCCRRRLAAARKCQVWRQAAADIKAALQLRRRRRWPRQQPPLARKPVRLQQRPQACGGGRQERGSQPGAAEPNRLSYKCIVTDGVQIVSGHAAPVAMSLVPRHLPPSRLSCSGLPNFAAREGEGVSRHLWCDGLACRSARCRVPCAIERITACRNRNSCAPVQFE